MPQPKSQIARLTSVELRCAWSGEVDFTRWLAQTENLSVLGNVLNLNLALEATEKNVGRFRADILCRYSDTEDWVLIENQLEETDHKHIGQLLTYASGLEAVTIVWIAAQFTDEHRATLDWLNRITDDSFSFFGVEVELWRIEQSAAAPNFKIVSMPVDWSRSEAREARAIEKAERSGLRRMQLNYWQKLNSVVAANGLPVNTSRQPQARPSFGYPLGGPFGLSVHMRRYKHKIGACLYIGSRNAGSYYHQLYEHRDEIEQEFGCRLSWEERPDMQHCRIACYLGDVDVENENDWPRQHEWFASRLNDLHFSGRINRLDPGLNATTD